MVGCSGRTNFEKVPILKPVKETWYREVQSCSSLCPKLCPCWRDSALISANQVFASYW
jgi:hypothetical protein